MTPRHWASAIVGRARKVGPVPRYGDDQWQQLPPTDPRFVAAIAVAAECWRTDGERLPERLRAEIAAGRRAEEKLDAEAFAETARRVRHMAGRPTHAELRRRRGDDVPPLTVLPGGAA